MLINNNNNICGLIKFGIAAMPLFKNYTFRVTSSKTCNKSHCKSKLLTTRFSKVALFQKHAVECSGEVHWSGSPWIYKPKKAQNKHAKIY